MTRPGNIDARFTLFTDYANHVARFGELADYHQAHQPPALVLWGRHDPFFDVDEVLAYHRVLERMDAHLRRRGPAAGDTPSRVRRAHTRVCARQRLS